ncbi:hypothetical protein FZI91_12890 [Mycobacterium sp. CBMA271]|uniref:hypothetical protein n=1 Tax=unclassified Mycobacteroides TaxID=2618759 RepID=UPI0012DC7A1B|nr:MULTISPECIES: hypothetical protein [unclassified Mycobacteroides]MUM18628.1 hypothetical protein [Mycobacteroides sp. CBMA 326]MUM22590.1 hypothetical protein [Mycobacteroides sp. CBMA 271]
MTSHGIAGYAAGCRCSSCGVAQRYREQAIAAAETRRWAAIEAARAPAWRRQELEVLRQKREAAKRKKRKEQEIERRELYQVALDAGDHQWLWTDDLIRIRQTHKRSRVLVQEALESGQAEFLWRQSQEALQLAEKHHDELKALIAEQSG